MLCVFAFGNDNEEAIWGWQILQLPSSEYDPSHNHEKMENEWSKLSGTETGERLQNQNYLVSESLNL